MIEVRYACKRNNGSGDVNITRKGIQYKKRCSLVECVVPGMIGSEV